MRICSLWASCITIHNTCKTTFLWSHIDATVVEWVQFFLIEEEPFAVEMNWWSIWLTAPEKTFFFHMWADGMCVYACPQHLSPVQQPHTDSTATVVWLIHPTMIWSCKVVWSNLVGSWRMLFASKMTTTRWLSQSIFLGKGQRWIGYQVTRNHKDTHKRNHKDTHNMPQLVGDEITKSVTKCHSSSEWWFCHWRTTIYPPWHSDSACYILCCNVLLFYNIMFKSIYIYAMSKHVKEKMVAPRLYVQ